ncbi:MAG: alpha/beta hydrolase [Erythrobacter sp.]|nr:alpha/beta hydrolase [Erythrobacter sp.]
MNRVLALFFAALALLLPGGVANAQSGARVVETISWVEEWDPVSQQWVRVEDGTAAIAPVSYEAATITEIVRAEPMRFIAQPARAVPGLAQFGPFRVLDDKRAAIVASTDAASPQAFAAMLAAFPGLQVIEFADAPGTSNDIANLKLGRAIRAAGLATHVPAGGSARSGAVELFLAGTQRTVAPGALFAVHSWRDELGREPDDFAADAPENRLYLDYYAEMGMSEDEARAFYAMTNSVPHAGALWLEGKDMAQWIAPRQPATRVLGLPSGLRTAHGGGHRAAHAVERATPRLAPRLAYAFAGAGALDSGAAFP